MKSSERDLDKRPVRVWYFSDLHGSELCYLKLLALASQVTRDGSVDAIVVGGDLCGDRLVPVSRTAEGWIAQFEGQFVDLKSANDLERFSHRLALKGSYAHECSDEEALRIQQDSEYAQQLLDRLALQRFEKWLSQLHTALCAEEGGSCKLILNTGSGDPLELDEILRRDPVVYFAESTVVQLPEAITIASTAYREFLDVGTFNGLMRRKVSPQELSDRIHHLLITVPTFSRCIFNFHVPPFGTAADQVGNPEHWPISPQHSGSPKIRQAIEFYEPLASLHGYAHNSRSHTTIKKTHVINPGSEFYNGRLLGALLEIDPEGELVWHLTEDPLIEADIVKDDKLFNIVIKSVVKNFVPFVGPILKVLDEIQKETRG